MMVALKTILRDYCKIILKILFEGVAFLIPALLLGLMLQVLFYPAAETLPFAPSVVAMVAFSVAFSKNYCFLEEEKYGLFESAESETADSTLSDFADR
jgi:hypothetical protein